MLGNIAHSSPYQLKERVGNSRTYIRPLQKDLDLSEVLGLPSGVSFHVTLLMVNYDVLLA